MGTVFMAAVASLVLLGCETDTNSLGANYDVSRYLFPSKSGSFVYRWYRAEKPEGESSFTDEAYQQEVKYTVRHGDKLTVITNADKSDESIDYMVEPERITVVEKEGNLTYHYDRNISTTDNFVQEAVIKKTVEAAGDTNVTYQCSAVGHIDSIRIESSQKEYNDILNLVCLRRETVRATVGGKRFHTLKKTTEEKQIAKGIGMIASKITTCNYAAIDDHALEQKDCVRDTYSIVTYVESDNNNQVLATSSNR